MLSKNLDNGVLYIFDDVIKLITKIAISEIDGVESSSSVTKDKVLQTLKGNYGSINIYSKEEEVTVDVNVAIAYGRNIPKTIYELQHVITTHIELFTGFNVKAINVVVDQLLMKE